MAEYKLTATDIVIRTADSANIPNDPDNTGRQQYERWLADGGVPDPYIPPIPSAQFDWGPRFIEVIGQER